MGIWQDYATTADYVADGIADPCSTCGAGAGEYCLDSCVWIVVGYGSPD